MVSLWNTRVLFPALFYFDQVELFWRAGQVHVVEEGRLAIDGRERQAREREFAEIVEQVAGDELELGGNFVGELQRRAEGFVAAAGVVTELGPLATRSSTRTKFAVVRQLQTDRVALGLLQANVR